MAIMGNLAGYYGMMGQKYNPAPPDPVEKSYKAHNAGVEQQAVDYGNIMESYKKLLAGAGSTDNQVTPAQYQYQPSTDVTNSMGMQQNLAQTGGYSPEDIANIRARGISPIRSIYSSANRNLKRQQGLSGGYSPNAAAGQAKLAREMSEQIGGAVTNVNANLAQNIAGNKMAGANSYAGTAGQQSALQNNIGMQNVESINAANRFNIGNKANIAGQAIQGMTSLYGTTPALVNTFGNQALQSAGLQNQIQQQANTTGLNQVGKVLSSADQNRRY